MTMFRLAVFAFAALILGISAGVPRPGNVAEAADHEPTHTQRDTTVVVLGAPRHPGTARIVEIGRLGSGRSGPEYEFTQIGPLGLTRDGGVLVVNRVDRSYTIAKFDSAGRYVRSFGRAGQGPGEFRAPRQARELSDGRVAVSDRGRILFYSATGEFLKSTDVGAANVPFGAPIHLDTLGNIYVEQVGGRAGGLSDGVAYLIRLSAAGAIADTLRFPTSSLIELRLGGTLGVPFSPIPISVWSAKGYFVSCVTDRFALNVTRPSDSGGSLTTVTSLRRNVEAVALQPGEREDWRRSIEMYLSVDKPWSWQGPPLPTMKPVISELRVADDGTLLVRLHQRAALNADVPMPTRMPDVVPAPASLAGRRWIEPIVYDLVDPVGTYIGRIALPSGMTNFLVNGNIVWGVTTDMDGVPQVRRYEIRWPA